MVSASATRRTPATRKQPGKSRPAPWGKKTGIEMAESIEQLGKKCLGGIDARIKAATRVGDLLAKSSIGVREVAEWRDALKADEAAEQALIKAREAYHAAMNPGAPFSSL